jgi:hypothetical protein
VSALSSAERARSGHKFAKDWLTKALSKPGLGPDRATDMAVGFSSMVQARELAREGFPELVAEIDRDIDAFLARLRAAGEKT